MGVYQTRTQKERDAQQHIPESNLRAGICARSLAVSDHQVELGRTAEEVKLLRLKRSFEKKPTTRRAVHNGSSRGFCASFVGDLPLKLKVSLRANKVSHGALYPGATLRARMNDAVLRICLEEALPMA